MDWKDACKKLQEEGLKFEFNAWRWVSKECDFTAKIEAYRIASQPIPDREDWREWCRNLKKLGVEFESQNSNGGWVTYKYGFKSPKTRYRIPAQPIPAGIEKYLEEEMPEQKQEKPEIPHLEQQIQWHKDSLHSLETGEKMREWEYRLVVGDGEWKICNDPHFSEKYEYRRKPRTVTYWHCAVRWEGKDIFDEQHQAQVAARAHQYFNNADEVMREQLRPFYLLRPRIFPDGNQWCALYGDNIQDGVCAFGSTPAEAATRFDEVWQTEKAGVKSDETEREVIQ